VTEKPGESFREAQEALERRGDPPRDEEEAAAFKRLGRDVTTIREERGMTREDLAPKSEMPVSELEMIEGGEIHARWGDLGKVAKGLGISLPELFRRFEEQAPGGGAEKP
jgi:ribosome-binding protein aMBF1 (putative translation factor)